MKSTGIIRKIDDLGRIVIPKELRKVLKIDNGDDLEIYVEDETIVLKKYSALLNSKDNSDKLVSSIYGLIDGCIYITDQTKVITKGELEGKAIDTALKKLIIERQEYKSDSAESIEFEDIIKNGFFIVKPIIQNSDANGLVIIFKETRPTNEDILFASIIKNIVENE